MKAAWGNITDATKVAAARMNSDYKDLDVAIVKATNHVESPPKEKHVRTIFAYTSASRPRADVAYTIHQIGKRLGKTHNWCVALKCLMVMHRTLREGDPTFREELINYERRGRTLNLSNFKDESGPAAWDYSAWVRTYALYLEERLECFRTLKYDVEAEKSSSHSRTRELDTPDLLDHLPALQSLLHRLMGCQPEGAAAGSFVIQAALGLVVKESFKLYRAINDGIINLVDKFFEMSRVDAAKALAIYKRAGEQADRLSSFYDMCKGLDLSRSFQFPTLDQPPQSFLTTMEEYDVAEEVVAAPPDAAAIEQQNALALAIVPGDGAPASAALPDGSTGWELALVAAPSSTAVAAPNPNVNSNLAGGFDKLTLDSLYEDAIRRSTNSYQNSYATSGPAGPPSTMLALPAPPGAFQATGPAAPGMQGPHDPFSASRHVPPPTNVQLATLAHQQQQAGGGFGPGGGMGMGGMPGGGYPGSAGQGFGGGYPMGGGPGMVNPFANPYGPPTTYGSVGMPPHGAAAAPAGGPGGYQTNPFGNPSLL
ncbi:unnamed protein product [Closterium sp. Yama58-4]|nr:unnamed protein product [Closterium sp. Yama58-4]